MVQKYTYTQRVPRDLVEEFNTLYECSIPDNILYGSNKEIKVYRLNDDSGELACVHNLDKISVFDAKGIIKLKSPGKGRVESLMTARIFKRLSEKGFNNHLVGIIDRVETPDGYREIAVPFEQSQHPTAKLVCKWLYQPTLPRTESGYDYTKCAQAARAVVNGKCRGTMLPFEIVWRDYVIAGISSCTKSQLVWEQFCDENNYSNLPGYDELKKITRGQLIKLPYPCIDMTTKFEVKDVPVTRTEYNDRMEIGERSPVAYTYDKIVMFATSACSEIRDEFLEMGIVVPDLKIEMGLDSQGQLMILDVVGPDEVRMYIRDEMNFDFSKQLYRNLYIKDSNWMKLVLEYKTRLGHSWKERFRKLGVHQPDLNPDILISVRYLNAVLSSIVFGAKKPEELKLAVGRVKKSIQKVRKEGAVFTEDLADWDLKNLIPQKTVATSKRKVSIKQS